MSQISDNPYASRSTEAVDAQAADTPASVLVIPFVCLLIGLIVGVSNLQGVEQSEFQIEPGTFVTSGHARVASLGDWVVASAWIVGGVIASGCSLLFLIRRHRRASTN